jgi:uncharacterized membrane protein
VEGSAPPVRETVEFTRIVAFTDGVFAIAITLLVLNFDVPRLPRESERQLAEALSAMGPDLGAYFLTFAVVGRMWVVHHDLFSTLSSFGPRLMTLNLAYLSMIVLVPFAAQLLGDFGDEPLPAALYGTVVGIAATINWLMTRHALDREFVHHDHRARIGAWGSRRALLLPALFLVSVPVAFVSPFAAEAMWTALIVDRIIRSRRGRGRSDG